MSAGVRRRIVCVRHGQTTWSREWRHTGRTDVPLEPAGEDEARALAPRLASFSFALVLVSPLARARRTAELAGYGFAAEPDADLVEWDYGTCEGATTREVRQTHPGWDLWRDGPIGGEAFEAIGARAVAVLGRVAGAPPGDVALFAHGHILRVIAATWLGLEPSGGRLFLLPSGRFGVLGFEHERHVIERWDA